MFYLADSAFDPEKLKAELINVYDLGSAGAFCVFEGRVRDHNDGQPVVELEYEAFPSLAQKEADRIIREAESQFPVIEVVCAHRTGTLHVGDLAVWVGVSAEHRDAAFGACRFVIDNIKLRLPVWKKEHYVDGSSEWVNCTTCAGSHVKLLEFPGQTSFNNYNDIAAASHRKLLESDFYSRQMLLPQIGVSGQEQLKMSRVLVVGAGGLGSSALLYLAAAGVGTIGICEFDLLEPSNLHRQILYKHNDVSLPKSQLAAKRVTELNPFIHVSIHGERLNVNNSDQVVAHYDLVLDCTDNFTSKYLINDACVKLGIPFVQASIYQYEGQILVYRPDSVSACMRCLYPETLEDGCVGACTKVGVLGAVAGLLGTWQAMEALKLILSLPTDLDRNLLLIDLLNCQTRKIKRVRSASCSACSLQYSPTGSNLLGLRSGSADNRGFASEQVDAGKFDLDQQPDLMSASHAEAAYNSGTVSTENQVAILESVRGVPAPHAVTTEVDIKTLAPDDLNNCKLIDIRETIERNSDEQRFGISMPFSNFDPSSLNRQETYLFFCARGVRSRILVERLIKEGFVRARSVEGGVVSVRRAFGSLSERCALIRTANRSSV